MTRIRPALALAALLFVLRAHAAGPPVPPSPTTYVTDGAGILPSETRTALEARLAAFEDETSNQVLVWTASKVPEGTTLEEFANAAFGAWKVGQRDRKNGLVFFVFPQDRAARIEVGYGLEGALPDALAGRILNDEVFPRFREGDLSRGVTAGVDAILAATKGEYTGSGSRRRARGPRRERIPWPVVFFLVFFLLPALLGRRRRRYWWLGGGGFGGGGFGGFGGGGGFGGFSGGGGSSGGGGASGRW